MTRQSLTARVLQTLLALLLIVGACGVGDAWAQSQETDPLASWNDGQAKQAILKFVAEVSQPGSAFVREPERIATFDNDGTLWAEQPIYFQFAFAIDRVKALASRHPEWKEKQPFRAALSGDMRGLAASG
jgi:hypothetical protein